MRHLRNFNEAFNGFRVICESIDRDIHLTLDNGGLPFVAEINGDVVRVYQEQFTYSDVEKVFYGEDRKGDKDATMLLKIGPQKYAYIGSGDIYEFETDEEITEFSSPIGNSAVPYPYAIGEKYVYLMLDKVYVDKSKFDSNTDLYEEFYSKKDAMELHPMRELKQIAQRK